MLDTGLHDEEDRMRIIVALDESSYSAHVLDEAAKLAGNTWADVTLLGLHEPAGNKGSFPDENNRHWDVDHPFVKTLRDYRKAFLSHFQEEGSPYSQKRYDYELVALKKGLWEELQVCRFGPKNLKVRIRAGNPAKEILAEAKEIESDLIVIGCAKGSDCIWEKHGRVAERVVNHAGYSVLVVKDDRKPDKIVCCLDHHSATQESIELINQMVTLYGTELQIVGVTGADGLSNEVEQKMQYILEYYSQRNIKTWLQLVDTSLLQSFVSQAAKENMIVLWMGKQSLMEKFLPGKSISKLVKSTRSSVLVLR